MSTADVISLVLAALPVIIALAGVLYKHLLERLPSAQREAVQGAAQLAVTSVDQVGASLAPAEKKRLATAIVQEVIKSPLVAGRCHVSPAVIEAIIEATVREAHALEADSELAHGPVGFSGGGSPPSAL